MLGSAIWIAPAVFAAISHVAERRLAGEPWPPLHEILFSGADWLIYAFLAPLIFWAVNRWPIVRPHVGRRMSVHFFFALLTCVLWATGGKVLQFLLMNTLNSAEAQRMRAELGDQIWQRLGLDLVGWIFITLPFGVIVYICVAGMAHAVRYFLEAREREVQLAKVSEQLAGARFSALQAQLNPHFLFNTLNTIAVRARDGDGAGTARMVEQLSDVLRRTLSRHRANEVALQEELDLIEQYLAIEQARFSDRLRPSFDVDPAARAVAVPSFALQHLVENAIRHGIARRPGAGQLRISARRAGDRLELTVEDDGAGFAEDTAAPKDHGIENTRERLRAMHGSNASLSFARAERGGTVATLRVPWREMAVEADVAET
jgi:two-component system, LytTR family, sensor kinase